MWFLCLSVPTISVAKVQIFSIAKLLGEKKLTQFLVIRNYAKETCGLFARIVGKVSAMTALQYINYINNKPIGRIKYALI